MNRFSCFNQGEMLETSDGPYMLVSDHTDTISKLKERLRVLQCDRNLSNSDRVRLVALEDLAHEHGHKGAPTWDCVETYAKNSDEMRRRLEKVEAALRNLPGML